MPAQPQLPPLPPMPPLPPEPGAPGTGAPGLEGLAGGARVMIGDQFIGVPRNAREMRVLRARRTELSNQLSNISSRRRELLQELERAEGPARPGLEARVALLDQRILQIETALAQTGQLVVAAPGEALGVQESRPPVRGRGGGGMDRGDVAGLGIALMFAVSFPLAIGFAVRMVRRSKLPPAARPSPEDAQRMLRMEQAIDTIAVEVERISEGQRFVTQLLAEQREPRQLVEGRTLDPAIQTPR